MALIAEWPRRRRVAAYVLALAMACLTGVVALAPAAQAQSGITVVLEDAATTWCLEGYASTLATSAADLDPAVGCTGDTYDVFQKEADPNGTECVHTYCGNAFYFESIALPHYCLSQNNAGSAYLTDCTVKNAYMTWIEIPAAGQNAFHLIDWGSKAGSTTWALSSNETPPADFPPNYGSVYTVAYTGNSYQTWYIYVPSV